MAARAENYAARVFAFWEMTSTIVFLHHRFRRGIPLDSEPRRRVS
jgi:hypothetical protein